MARTMNEKMRRTAILVGSGVTKTQAAKECGISRRTCQSYSKNPAWQKLAQDHRDRLLQQAPDAAATLQAALSAVKGNGEPDHAIRVKAAAILITGKTERPREPEAQAIEYHPDLIDGDSPGCGVGNP